VAALEPDTRWVKQLSSRGVLGRASVPLSRISSSRHLGEAKAAKKSVTRARSAALVYDHSIWSSSFEALTRSACPAFSRASRDKATGADDDFTPRPEPPPPGASGAAGVRLRGIGRRRSGSSARPATLPAAPSVSRAPPRSRPSGPKPPRRASDAAGGGGSAREEESAAKSGTVCVAAPGAREVRMRAPTDASAPSCAAARAITSSGARAARRGSGPVCGAASSRFCAFFCIAAACSREAGHVCSKLPPDTRRGGRERLRLCPSRKRRYVSAATARSSPYPQPFHSRHHGGSACRSQPVPRRGVARSRRSPRRRDICSPGARAAAHAAPLRPVRPRF
jgi:hypothetical protein